MEKASIFRERTVHPHGLMRSNSLPPKLTREYSQKNNDLNIYSQAKFDTNGRTQVFGGSFDSKLRNTNSDDWTDFDWRNEQNSESFYSMTDIESDYEKCNSQFKRKYKLQNDVKCETLLGRKCEGKFDEKYESMESSDCESANEESLYENYDMFLVKEKESSLDLLKNIWIRKVRQGTGNTVGQAILDRTESQTWQTNFYRQDTKPEQTSSDGSGTETGQNACDIPRSKTLHSSHGSRTKTRQTESGRPETEIRQNEPLTNGDEITIYDTEQVDRHSTVSFNGKNKLHILSENDILSDESSNDDENGEVKNDLFRNDWSQGSEMNKQKITVKVSYRTEQESKNENSYQIYAASEAPEVILNQKKDSVVKKIKLPTDKDLKGANLFNRKTSKVLYPRVQNDSSSTKQSPSNTEFEVNLMKNDGHHGNKRKQHQSDAAVFDTESTQQHEVNLVRNHGNNYETILSTTFSKTYGTFHDNWNESMSIDSDSDQYGTPEDGNSIKHNEENKQFSSNRNGSHDLEGFQGQSSESEGNHINDMVEEETENSYTSTSSIYTTVQQSEHVCHHQHHYCCAHHGHQQHQYYQVGSQKSHHSHHSHNHGKYYKNQGQMMQMTLLMETLAESSGFEVHDVKADGNCMYRSVVDQLRMHGELEITALSLRQMAVEFLKDNPCHEDGTHLQEFLSAETWDDYLSRMMKDGEWGDQIMLRGIAEVTGRKICITSAIGDSHNQITIEPSKAEADQSENIFLGHIDDFHYVSLRPKNWRDTWHTNVKKKMENKKKKSEQSTPRSEQREINLVEQKSKEMPETQNQGSESLKFPSTDEVIDTTSGVPYYHLSFIIRHVLSEKYFKINIYDNLESHLKQSQSNNETEMYVCGSVMEKLDFSIVSTNSEKSSFAFLRRNLQSVKKAKLPTLYLLGKGNKRVFFNGQDATHGGDIIAVTHEVHPGYLRLQPLYPYPELDKTWIKGHIPCINTSVFQPSEKTDLPNMHTQEPYDNSTGKDQYNVIVTYWSHSWPESALKWITRDRPSGWPEHDKVQEVLNDGCFIVPTHHPMSKQPECEWRFSFALSERRLACAISKSQRYCFQIFKALVDYFTEDKSILSTYFLKTVFFHVCETITKMNWRTQPEFCILYLFDKLLQCLRQKNLPHYFILENNIIDHLKDSDIQFLITRLEAVRKCPAIAVVLLAESHCLPSSTLSDPVLKDISQFLNHKDLKRSAKEVIVPTLFERAQKSLDYMKFEAATENVKAAHSELRRSNDLEAREDQLVQFSSFAMEFINGLQMPQKFWFCFFLDYFYDTDTTSDLTRDQTCFRTIKEIFGAEIHEGEFDDVPIPENILQQSGCDARHFAPDISFMQELCDKLFSAELYEEAAYYLRCFIKKLKQNIENPEQFEYIENRTQNIGPKNPEQSEQYQKQVVISLYNEVLKLALISLFHCYYYTYNEELFQEYISDLEEICDRVPSATNYQSLSVIWGHLGNQDKVKEALRKKEMMQ